MESRQKKVRAGRLFAEVAVYETPSGKGGNRLARRFPTIFFHAGAVALYCAAALEALRGRYDQERFRDFSVYMLRLTEWVGGRVHVTGLDRLRSAAGPVVIVGNHMSALETSLLPAMVLSVRRTAIVLKEDLLRYPVFGRIVRSWDYIAVTRRNPREDLERVLTRGVEMLKAGISVLLFPQATRKTKWAPESFNTLGAKLAKRAAVPLVPVALKTDFLGNGRWIKDFGRVMPLKVVRISFEDPVPAGMPPREAHERVVAALSARLVSWGVDVEHEQEGRS